MIIPSIDLMNDKAVQLIGGKEKVIEVDDAISIAKEFSVYGEIAVIDLDAALGKGDNHEIIKKICKIADCRVGGGIRTVEMANQVLSFGAKKVIIGTHAVPDFLKQFPRNRVIVAVDSVEDKVVDKGWTNMTNFSTLEKIKETENYCSEFLYTDVNREGRMNGIDIEKIKKIVSSTKNKVTIAGGISSIEEIKEVENLAANPQLGMCLYTGKIDLAGAFVELVDFEKNNGLIPTIVKNYNKDVLMLAYSTKESLKRALQTRRGTYYSRTRKMIWQKGETSGNYQDLIRVKSDCDRDTLLFTVKQKDVACHEGIYSCFGEREFGLDWLFEIIEDRKTDKSRSYTRKLLNDKKELYKKIIEESNEVVNFKNRENLVWELADLTYFICVLMNREKISAKEILNELWRRRK